MFACIICLMMSGLCHRCRCFEAQGLDVTTVAGKKRKVATAGSIEGQPEEEQAQAQGQQPQGEEGEAQGQPPQGEQAAGEQAEEEQAAGEAAQRERQLKQVGEQMQFVKGDLPC